MQNIPHESGHTPCCHFVGTSPISVLILVRPYCHPDAVWRKWLNDWRLRLGNSRPVFYVIDIDTALDQRHHADLHVTIATITLLDLTNEAILQPIRSPMFDEITLPREVYVRPTCTQVRPDPGPPPVSGHWPSVPGSSRTRRSISDQGHLSNKRVEYRCDKPRETIQSSIRPHSRVLLGIDTVVLSRIESTSCVYVRRSTSSQDGPRLGPGWVGLDWRAAVAALVASSTSHGLGSCWWT